MAMARVLSTREEMVHFGVRCVWRAFNFRAVCYELLHRWRFGSASRIVFGNDWPCAARAARMEDATRWYACDAR